MIRDASLELDLDLQTGEISVVSLESGSEESPAAENPGEETPQPAEEQGAPVVFSMAAGDKRLVSLGFRKHGELIDPFCALINVSVAEYEPERKFPISDGTFRPLSTEAGEPRFQLELNVPPSLESAFAAILSGNEEDDGTWVEALAEVEYTVLADHGSGPVPVPISSQLFRIQMRRDLVSI